MSRRLLAPVLALSLATACNSPEVPAPEPAAEPAAVPADSGWSQFGGDADGAGQPLAASERDSVLSTLRTLSSQS